MMDRQTFLRSLFPAAASVGLLATIGKKGIAWPSGDPDSETFWHFVRRQFPLMEGRAYLNTGGLGASPYVVLDAVKSKMDELERICEHGHDEALWQSIKSSAARLLGCDPEEIAFTRNTTEGINIVANGLPLKKGDEIITTTHEHVGNSLTWLALSKRTGARIKVFEPSTTSSESLERIEHLMTRRTRLLTIPHATTTTGLIMPVKEIAHLAASRKVWFLVDGAQTAGMMPLNLHEIGCDAYATSGHKWLMGPKETGLLYVRREMLDVIQAKHVGAYSEQGFDWRTGMLTLHPSAQRYEYGTVSVPLRVGLGAAIDFVQRIGIRNIWKRDMELSTLLMKLLLDIPGVEVLSPQSVDNRSAMITFQHARFPFLAVLDRLTTFNIRARSVTEGGLSALRVSTHCYNTPEELHRVLEAVQSLERK